MKKIRLLLSTLIMLFIPLNVVLGASGYAFTIGTNYGDGNSTTSHASYAYNVLSGLGYTTTKLTIPTYSTINAKISGTSRYKLESDILYFIFYRSWR